MARQVEADAPAPRVMIDEKEVLRLTKLSRSTRHRLVREGKFPRGVYVSPNIVRWYLDTIIKWQNALDEKDWFDPHRKRGPGRKRRQREQAEAAS